MKVNGLAFVAIASIIAMAQPASAVPDTISVDEQKYIAVFCGAEGHEDGTPGYGQWLKARLDAAGKKGIGPGVSLSIMSVVYCGTSSI